MVKFGKQPLPFQQNRIPAPIKYFTLIGAGLGVWGWILTRNNQSRKQNTSLFKSLVFHMKNSKTVQRAIGEEIKLTESKAPFFSPVWVDGKINMVEGSADISFVLEGKKDANVEKGVVIYRAKRNEKGQWNPEEFVMETKQGLIDLRGLVLEKEYL